MDKSHCVLIGLLLLFLLLSNNTSPFTVEGFDPEVACSDIEGSLMRDWLERSIQHIEAGGSSRDDDWPGNDEFMVENIDCFQCSQAEFQSFGSTDTKVMADIINTRTEWCGTDMPLPPEETPPGTEDAVPHTHVWL